MDVGEVSESTSADLTQQISDLDQEAFLKLLLAELANQDPMDPLDGREFITQLATLAEVEQSQETNDSLETLLQFQSSINNAQAVSLLGKRVLAAGDEFTYNSSNVDLSFYLEKDASSVDVKIYSSDGELVRTMSLGAQNAGSVDFTWDGLDSDGSEVSNGNYTFEVVATDEDGNAVTAQTLIEGIVESLSFDTDGLHLIVNGNEISLSDIYEVRTE